MPVVVEPSRPERSILKLSLGVTLGVVVTLLAAIFVVGAPTADAATYTLTGGCGAPCNWSNPSNWSGGPVGTYPGQVSGDTASVCGVGTTLTVDVNVPNGVLLSLFCTTATVDIPAAGALQIEASSLVGSAGNAITVNGGSFSLNGAITNSAASITVNSGTAANLATGAYSSSTFPFTVAGGTFTNSGTFAVPTGGTFALSGGTLTNNTPGGFTVNGGTFTWSGGTINGTGFMAIQTGGSLNITDSVGPTTLDTQQITISPGGSAAYSAPSGTPLSINNGGRITNNATFTLTTDAPINSNLVSAPGFDNSGGTLSKSGGTGTTNFNLLFANSAGTVSIGPSLLNMSFNNGGTQGGAFTCTGCTFTFGGAHTIDPGTTFSGASNVVISSLGSFLLNTNLSANATLTNSGAITFQGASTKSLDATNYVQNATGALTMRLNGTVPVTNFDQLRVTGSVTLAGTINETLGYAPVDGQTWNIITSTSEGGDFTTRNLPSYATGIVQEQTPTASGITLIAVPQADLGVIKTGPASVLDGQTASYTVKVTNAGPSAAIITMTDIFSAPASFNSVSPGSPTCVGSGPVTCTFTLASGGTQFITLLLNATATGTITNSASVSSSVQDPNPGDNSASASTTVNPAADLSISSVTAATDPINAGATETFTINYANAGPDSATSAVVNLLLTGGTITSASGAGFTCTPSSCTAATLAPGSGTITVLATAPAQAGTMTLAANISSATGDPNSGNNSASSAAVTVNALTDLQISKALSSALDAGANATYTITVTNLGPSDAASVTVTDLAPAGLTFVSNSGACTTSFPCTLGTLTAGSSLSIVSTYSVPSNATGSVSNTATVGTSTPDSNSANDTATTNDAIVVKADLSISKSLSGTLIAGQNAVYNITVTNNGPADATGVGVDDIASAPLTFVSATSPCASFPCTIGTMTAGQTVTFSATYAVPSNASGSTSNTATVTATTSDPTPGNNSSTVSSAIAQKADISVIKTGPSVANTGATISYVITVSNLGPSDAASVVLDDPTPSRLSFVSASTPCSGGFPCALGNMVAGASQTITAQYTVLAGPTATIINVASANSSTTDMVPSNNSASVSTSTGCPTATPGNLTPADGATNVPTSGVLSWSDVGAAEYDVYLDVAGPNACTKFFASTSATSVQFAGLQEGMQYQWRVEAVTGGCQTLSSACLTFTTKSTCPTAAPTLISPVNTTVVGPATFSWSAVSSAVDYKLFVNNVLIATTTSTSYGPVAVGNGSIGWYVVAEFAAPCGALQSAAGSFNGCDNSTAPLASVVGEAASGQGYDVSWNVLEGATRHEVDEATDPDFVNLTTRTANEPPVHFVHNVDTTTAFYYRVRSFLPCANGFTPNSPTIRVVLTPITQVSPNPNVSVPAGNSDLVPIVVHVPGFPDGTFPFTATVDKPWLVRVDPSSGLLPPEGIDLTVYADPRTLPNGTFTGTLILTVNLPSTGSVVTNGVTTVSAPVSISLVTPVTPKPQGTPPPNALIIPSVGHLDGINSHWQSDIRVANTSSQTAHYQLTFTPDDAAKGVKQTVIEVGPGVTTALDDIIKTWYGVGSLGETANGVLEIRPAASSGKTANDVSVSLATVASSRTYNVASKGTLGQFIPAIAFSNFIGRAADASHVATILGLQQVAQSASYRTNLGVVEGSGNPVSVLISAFDDAGKKLLDFPLNLAANQQVQLNSFLAQNKITNLADGRLEVQVVSGEGKITAYASVVDNASGDPLLVSGVPLGQILFDHYALPGVADLNTGIAAWRTDMRIFNPTTVPQFVTLEFHAQNSSAAPQTTSLTVNPGETKRIDNALSTLFGISNVGGALQLSTGIPSSLVVTGRTYNLTSNGTFGQFIPAVTAANAVGKGDRSLQILQAEESVRYRTNLGITEVTGKPATVEVSVVLPDSKVSPSTQIPIAASGFVQVPVIQSLGLTNVYNARISVRVVDGDGKIAAYGSVIDQKTQDPTMVPAQ